MIAMKKQGEWLIGTIPDEVDGLGIGSLLREHWKWPKKQVHLLFQHKEVWLEGNPAAQHVKVAAGQEIKVRACAPEPFGLDPSPEKLQVLYEDDHLLIVNKPAGMLLHPTEKFHKKTLDHLVAGHFERTGVAARVRHVHRLDQETSGVVMYAKHALASALLDEHLRERKIKRHYIAYVHGRLSKESGTISEPIGKDRFYSNRRRVTPTGDAAVTHYRVTERFETATKLECELETGRTHQIRVHLSYVGFPLIGDTLYGGKEMFVKRQALHAAILRFSHPFGMETLEVSAALPPDLQQLESRLRHSPMQG
ncbi:RluA family pseudouridine synthase [Brevibacillus borstelensis]|jgi:23S rRNA pseudouridine1911/1915/1917 synthase|uniref:RluA family pseudouridine synthase n=1 Tax=Brevibacillus TaxID=55080 RepID=UPI0004694280|nr:RluA family pseudouridine synthase [Brevibacillus borstelensis]MED2011069.1 RluA family pseudouridine synthase [Brevibacillus borstelensis]